MWLPPFALRSGVRDWLLDEESGGYGGRARRLLTSSTVGDFTTYMPTY